MHPDDLLIRLETLVALPGVTEAVGRARDACTGLRWHQALRRRTAEAAAESRVRGATASALLEGAEPAGSVGSLPLVRDLMRGARAWPERPDPVDRVLRGAVQVTARSEHVDAAALRSPAQVLAGLHVAAAAPLVPEDQLGRPRRDTEDCPEGAELGTLARGSELSERLDGVAALLQLLPQAPVLLVASLVHAEVATLRPFVQGNGLVARALERAVVRVGGLEPTGVAVTEAGHSVRAGSDYRGALAAYASRSPDGVRLWLLHCADSVVAAAGEGARVADAVLAGRVASPRDVEYNRWGGDSLRR